MKHHRIITMAVLLLLSGSLLISGAQHPTQAQTDQRCFTETGLCIEGQIRQFWEQNGGLPVFGLPISAPQQVTAQIDGQERQIQIQRFERNRLELHPENDPPFDVLLGRLGVDVLEQQGRDWLEFPRDEAAQPGCRYFAETRQNVCGDILSAWQANGLELDDPGISERESLALFGLPISPLQEEEIEGNTYQVQWFERARFELHPENPPSNNVLLGLLGTEALPSTPDGAAEQPPPQGERLAYTSVGDDGNQNVTVCTLQLEQPEGDPCPGAQTITRIPENDGQPAWSPDNSQLAFESNIDGNWNVYIVNATPESRHTALTRTDGTDGTDEPPADATDGAPTWGSFPEIGWHIVFQSNRPNTAEDQDFDLWVVDSGSRANQYPLLNEAANEAYPTLSPDATKIAYASDAAGEFDIYVADLIIQEERVTLGETRQNLTENENIGGNSVQPAWSQDGNRIAFENDTNADGNWEIWVMNADGSEPQQLTNNPGADRHPTWSPDNSWIAFQSNRVNPDGPFSIYIMPANMTEDPADPASVPRLLVDGGAFGVFHPAWMGQ